MSLSESVFGGAARNFLVKTLTYPLEVMKIQLQANEKEKYVPLAARLFKTRGFYKGFHLELVRSSISQIWVWPLVTHAPTFYSKRGCSQLQSQALTGLSIASISAFITTPIDGKRIRSIVALKAYYRNWQGVMFNFAKLGVNWSTFLTLQKFFRERSEKKELTWIGLKVAAIVSIVGAPFDVAYTLKQTGQNPFLSGGLLKYYRGYPLQFVSLVIHNVASVTLIDKLEGKTG